jgi:hypothetical protein
VACEAQPVSTIGESAATPSKNAPNQRVLNRIFIMPP